MKIQHRTVRDILRDSLRRKQRRLWRTCKLTRRRSEVLCRNPCRNRCLRFSSQGSLTFLGTSGISKYELFTMQDFNSNKSDWNFRFSYRLRRSSDIVLLVLPFAGCATHRRHGRLPRNPPFFSKPWVTLQKQYDASSNNYVVQWVFCHIIDVGGQGKLNSEVTSQGQSHQVVRH